MTNDPNISAIPADKNQVVLDAEIQTAAELKQHPRRTYWSMIKSDLI